MSEWKKVRLGEITSIKTGKLNSCDAVEDGCYPFFTCAENPLRINTAACDSESVLVAGNCTPYVNYYKGKFNAYQRTYIITPTAEDLFGRWLFYWMRQEIKMMIHRQQGSVEKYFVLSDFTEVELTLPPLPTQRKIAAVLSSLDDKIENNRKICANLEAQAQAIFKSWFVDFEPFGGKMPQGWKTGKLGELIEVCYGKDHKALPEGDIPVFGSGGYMRSVDRCIFDEESVLIPRKGTLNNIMYVNEPFWTVDTMFYSKMREEHVAKYVHLLLQGKNMDEFNVGSAVPSMTTEILNNMEIIIPLPKTLKEFDGIASSFYAEVAHAKKESRSLAAMRDALLPKLMSGEIDVEKVGVQEVVK